MAGRPSAAAERAAKWLLADATRTAPQAAKRFGLSVSQAQRIAARLGLARPVGLHHSRPVA